MKVIKLANKIGQTPIKADDFCKYIFEYKKLISGISNEKVLEKFYFKIGCLISDQFAKRDPDLIKHLINIFS